ncbi:UNVERIFIED_CONTAM: hypothetical protein PYX00_004089 [Menopon gallinae]|uniref:Uncharacterized protein n=1 Tax=Menopon gallinae TaxID=328185 RepID=A0AAW2I2Y0_9NEOP
MEVFGKIIILCVLCAFSSASHHDKYEIEFLVDFLRFLTRSSCIFVDEATGLGDFARNFIGSAYVSSKEDMIDFLATQLYGTGEKIVILMRDQDLKAYKNVFDVDHIKTTVFELQVPGIVSRFTWILMVNVTFDPRGIAPVPYDCEFYTVRSDVPNRYEITEIFTVKNTEKLFSKSVGTWTPENRLTMPHQRFFSRRMDLEGYPMKVFGFQDECPSDIHCSFVEIWFELARYMNITTQLVTNIGDERYFSNASWTYDVFLEPFTFDADAPVTTAIAPVWKLTVHIYVKRVSDHEFSWALYISSFGSNFVTTFSLWVIFVSVSLTFFDYYHLKLSLRRRRFEKSKGIFAVLFWICNQGGVEVETSLSVFFLVFTVRLAVLVLQSLASTALVSFLTLQIPVYPFYDVDGFLQDNTYKLGTVNDSFTEFYFLSVSPWELEVAAKFLPVDEMPRSLREGADMVCSDEKLAFLAYNRDFLTMGPQTCEILQIPTPVANILCGIVLEYNSPFESVFNSVYIHFLEFGIAAKMRRGINGEVRLGKGKCRSPPDNARPSATILRRHPNRDVDRCCPLHRRKSDPRSVFSASSQAYRKNVRGLAAPSANLSIAFVQWNNLPPVKISNVRP